MGDVWSRGGLQPQQGTQTGDTTWMTPNPFYLRNRESADVLMHSEKELLHSNYCILETLSLAHTYPTCQDSPRLSRLLLVIPIYPLHPGHSQKLSPVCRGRVGFVSSTATIQEPHLNQGPSVATG